MATTADTTAPLPSPLHIQARWDRNLVLADGGTAYLLVTIIAAPQPATINRRSPVDVAFVLDRSGSMSGEKLELAKRATQAGLDRLGPEDRAALVIYDHEVEVVHYLSHTTDRSKARIRRLLDALDSRGSTNLSDGWLTGCSELSKDMGSAQPRRVRRAILLTDGQANMGIVDPGELMRHAAELRKRGVSTTTVGVGEDFEEFLLSGMAEAGGGNFQYIAKPAELPAFFKEELGELVSLVAGELRLTLRTPHGLRAELINTYPSERFGKEIIVSLGDLPAGKTINLVFECTIKPGAVRNQLKQSIAATWTEAATDRTQQQDVAVESLVLATRYDVEQRTVDSEVAEEVAFQIATAREREAMRLDHEGRHRESRAMLASNASLLQAAPSSPRVAELHAQMRDLSQHSATLGFASGVRKQSVSDSMRRSRGRKDDADSATS